MKNFIPCVKFPQVFYRLVKIWHLEIFSTWNRVAPYPSMCVWNPNLRHSKRDDIPSLLIAKIQVSCGNFIENSCISKNFQLRNFLQVDPGCTGLTYNSSNKLFWNVVSYNILCSPIENSTLTRKTHDYFMNYWDFTKGKKWPKANFGCWINTKAKIAVHT
jgi:hypothetical protein